MIKNKLLFIIFEFDHNFEANSPKNAFAISYKNLIYPLNLTKGLVALFS